MAVLKTFLFMIYSGIVILTILSTATLIKYLKSKALQKKFVRDQVLIDLASLSGGFVVIMATVILVRIVVGPFQNEDIVETIFSLIQYWCNSLLACLVSLQLVQVLSIFWAAELSEWPEEMLIAFHRLFVMILGISSAGLVCFLQGGFCRPTPLYNYILQENKNQDDPGQFQVQSLNIMIFILIITLCQLAIEMKKFLINKEENRIDQIAVSALRQMENATVRLNREPPRELRVVNFLPLRVNISWQNMRGDEAPVNDEHLSPRASANAILKTENNQFSNQNTTFNNSSRQQARFYLI
jgi:hypothetical protein